MPSPPSASVFGSWERDVTIGTLVFGLGTDMLWSDGLLEEFVDDAISPDLRSVSTL